SLVLFAMHFGRSIRTVIGDARRNAEEFALRFHSLGLRFSLRWFSRSGYHLFRKNRYILSQLHIDNTALTNGNFTRHIPDEREREYRTVRRNLNSVGPPTIGHRSG